MKFISYLAHFSGQFFHYYSGGASELSYSKLGHLHIFYSRCYLVSIHELQGDIKL